MHLKGLIDFVLKKSSIKQEKKYKNSLLSQTLAAKILPPPVRRDHSVIFSDRRKKTLLIWPL